MRDRLLDPVDRVSEVMFGLIMAVTFVGSLSVATAGQADVRTATGAALGCNLAWGLVDAVMFLVRTATDRARIRTLARRIVGSDAATAQRLIADLLPPHVVAVAGPEELEGMRRRLLTLPPQRSMLLGARDYLAALGVFLLVVLATFPVVLPFLLITEVPVAFRTSQAITLAMLFLAGLALGRHAGYARPLVPGIVMAVFGAVLIAAVMALGG